jgi:hypothetical protein
MAMAGISLFSDSYKGKINATLINVLDAATAAISLFYAGKGLLSFIKSPGKVVDLSKSSETLMESAGKAGAGTYEGALQAVDRLKSEFERLRYTMSPADAKLMEANILYLDGQLRMFENIKYSTNVDELMKLRESLQGMKMDPGMAKAIDDAALLKLEELTGGINPKTGKSFRKAPGADDAAGNKQQVDDLFEPGKSKRTDEPSSSGHVDIDQLVVRTANLDEVLTAGDTAPMQFGREIKKGEKISDLIREIEALTKATGNEYAIVKLKDGRRAIVYGNSEGIFFKEGEVEIIFGHSHPTGAGASAADYEALHILDQSQQTIIHDGKISKIRKKDEIKPIWRRLRQKVDFR